MKEKLPFLSVVVPYRNRARLFRHMLGSITWPREASVELLLVDNASSDEAPQVALEFSQGMERKRERETAGKASGSLVVRLLECPKGNACDARNKGLEEARAGWVYFFDSDDEMSEGFFDDVCRELQRRPALQLLALSTLAVNEAGQPVKRRGGCSDRVAWQVLTSRLATQSMVFDRDFLLGIGGWNRRLPKWNDWELGVRALCARPRMAWVEGRTFHRILLHADSITGSDLASTYERVLPALASVRCLLRGRGTALPHGKERNVRATETILPEGERKRAVRALAAREAILSGQLAREGCHTPSQEMMALSLADVRWGGGVWPMAGLWLRCLRCYTSVGGRGGWMLARLLC